MKCVFLTNQASYHQMHFARAMVAELGVENFRIVFERGTSADRAEMGWKDDYTESYIIRFSDSEQAKTECHQWIADADVVIQGRFSIKHVRERILAGKLTFACQERLWKKPPSWYRRITRLPHLYKNYYSVDKPNYHLLAIGAYAAKDLNDLGVFKDRSWKYGYFIDCPPLPNKPDSDSLKLLWCARFSEVKQPHRALEILQGLKSGGLDVQLTMVGNGDLRHQIEARVQAMGLSEQVILTGWQNQEQVFGHMAVADLFLMTSHHGEGWGLVVNEALNHGCGVIANQQLGAARWLVQNGDNGFLYQDSEIKELTERLASMSTAQIKQLGVNGHRFMRETWSATEAATRTIALAEALLSSDHDSAAALYQTGACSPA